MLSSMSLRCCRAGLRMLPRSPPVQVTTWTSTPSATYRAIVAAPLLDSSSGCAWTAIRRRWSFTRQFCPTQPLNTSRGPVNEPGRARPPGRYGENSRGRRVALVVAVALVAASFLGWLGWAAWRAANPDTRSEVISFQVLDDHRVQVRF